MSGRDGACPTENTLARFIDGGDEPSVLSHIARCAACREVVALAAAKSGPRAGAGVGAASIDTGSVIAGKYRVIRQIGAGGMGRVLAARHEDLGQLVAIKIMLGTPDAETTKRFLREGRVGAKLRSDHAVRVYDLGRLDGGEPFLVMEYLEGESLEARRRRYGRLSFDEALSWITQASEAIGEAHGLGLVHRDIKPQNMFVETLPDGRERLKVLDFGLARQVRRAADDPSVLTTYGQVLGSPSFMSPEHIQDPTAVGPAADVWSLAATFFQLVTGRPPYVSSTVEDLLARIVAEPPPRATALEPSLPPHLDRVLARAMSKDPSARHASVHDFVTDLQRPALAPAPARRRRWPVALLPAFGLLSAAVSLALVLHRREEAPPSPPVEVASVLPVSPRPVDRRRQCHDDLVAELTSAGYAIEADEANDQFLVLAAIAPDARYLKVEAHFFPADNPAAGMEREFHAGKASIEVFRDRTGVWTIDASNAADGKRIKDTIQRR